MNNYISKMYMNKYDSKILKNSKGEFHKLDGPALEYSNGDKFWYKEGREHRLDGPAKDLSCGYKSWWKEGLLHRADGPAIERSNGKKHWYILNKSLEEEDFNSWMIRIKIFI